MSNQKNIKQFFIDMFKYQESNKYNFVLPESETTFVNEDPDSNKLLEDSNLKVYTSLNSNLDYIKVKYNALINSDIIIREFTLNSRNKQYNAFLFYIDGMVDSKIINDFVLEPLMLRNRANIYDGEETRVISEIVNNNTTIRKVKKFDLATYIYNSLVPQNSIEEKSDFEEIISDINSGNCALFIDTLDIAFDIDVKGFKQRSIDSPNNEIVIKGPQEAFVEAIRTNTSLIRRIVNNENLVIESISIGKVSKTKCAVCYINNIANNDLVSEVKYRLNNLDIDSLTSTGELEQLIEDTNKYSIPQILSTERPDKATKYLLGGRVVVLINGNPYALIMPATFIDFISSPEDTNLRVQFANFLKILRALAMFLTLLLPGLYLATTNFHQELIPTELLFSILASRENVPFPIIFELLVMEVSFELIREAGLRVPSPVGPTIGIVGALVLGQAAVSANIVSPILIIVVAITGIASFAIPDFSFGFHLRFLRFIFIILGYLAGYLAIAIGLFVYITILCSLKSFGVPYMVPYAPVTNFSGNSYFISPTWKNEQRADYLNTKKPKSQNHISMKWRYGKNEKGG